MNANTVVIQACPFNGKVCRNGKRDDFEINPQTGEKFLCAKWVCLKGKNPQSEEVFDDWMCNEAAIPMLLVENSQMTRFVASGMNTLASQVSGLRGEVNSTNQILFDASQTRLLDADPRIKNGNQIEHPGE